MFNSNLALNFQASYTLPCVKVRSSSLDSVWLYPSDFGECYNEQPDSHHYPSLSPVYNGKSLNLKYDLVHSSLSGISIKHYYGKCIQEVPIEELFIEEDTEMYGHELFFPELETLSESTLAKSSEKTIVDQKHSEQDDLQKKDNNMVKVLSTEGSAGDRKELKGLNSSKPICIQSRINFRNSFWNLHKPELCKLTWPQSYVTTAVVMEYLHEHLIPHGALCLDFHDEGDRKHILNKELDEYVRLKELLPPSELPPDEDFIDFVMEEEVIEKFLVENPRCHALKAFERPPIIQKSRFLRLTEDEDTKGKTIRRSKEEFCITIGKHIRKLTTSPIDHTPAEELYYPDISYPTEEEDLDMYPYDWDLYDTEQTIAQPPLDGSISEEYEPEPPIPIVDPCPPLNMDEFCRAIRKADFSDLRCNPDDF